MRGVYSTLDEAVIASNAVKAELESDGFGGMFWWHVCQISTQAIVAASDSQAHGAPSAFHERNHPNATP